MEIKDLNVEIQNKPLLSNISLNFYEGISIFLCGPSASGKTCLLKTIAGLNKYRGHIIKQGKVEVVLDRESFLEESLIKEINYNNLDVEEQKMIHKFISKTDLNKKISELEEETKILIRICKAFLNKPALLFIDNILFFLKPKTLQKIKGYLKKNHITLVCVSNDIEKALYFDYMIVMNKGSVAIEGKTLQVLEQEKILKRLGVGLPFYVDLSIQLKLYGLIDKIYTSKEDLRGALWK